MNLADVLLEVAAEAARKDRREDPSLDPSAQVAALRDVAARYATGCPFKPGDIVTARQGYNSRSAGKPAVVLETRDRPDPMFIGSATEDTCSNSFGRRVDMRVAVFAGKGISPFWVESWEYEPFVE